MPPGQSKRVRINEVLPAPATDWNSDGAINGQDEWIELFNAGKKSVALGGWTLASNAGTYVIPANTQIGGGAYLVLYGTNTLADSGDAVRLIGPDSTVVDSVSFGPMPADAGYSRANNGKWHSDWSPSPGAQNAPPDGHAKYQKLSGFLKRE